MPVPRHGHEDIGGQQQQRRFQPIIHGHMVYNRNVAFVPRGAPPREDLVSLIEGGRVAPIYCLHGAERYLVDRCLAAIRAAVIGGAAAPFAAFNHDVFDLRETEIGTVVSTARTLPM